MKVLIVGDFKNNTGPASVNKTMKLLDDSIEISVEEGRVRRIIELFIKLIKADYIVFSGLSKLNLIGFKLTKIFNKKSAYLMHGYSKVENELEGIIKEELIIKEREVLKQAPVIICVSKLFMEQMKEMEYQYKEKFNYIMNPVNTKIFLQNQTVDRNENLIISVGGGKKRKNILNICKAIELLNQKYNKKYKFLVVGSNEGDIDKIKAFKFVQYIESIEYINMPKYYSKCKLYIQNSSFETFGLAPVEALLCGANILISNNIGCRDILPLKESDIILNVNDIEEIARKILINMKVENNTYLKKGMAKNKFSKISLIEAMEGNW